jgi:two-component system cell cycle response regulator
MTDSSNAPGSKSAPETNDATTLVNREDLLKLKEKEKEAAKSIGACLIVVKGSPQGHRFFLNQTESVLGRDPTADISIADGKISRKHAVFKLEGANVTLTDLGSANGTEVNDRVLNPNEPVILKKNDTIVLGASTKLEFLPAGEVKTVDMGELSSAVNTDGLTGVFNKRYLIQAIETEFKRAKAMRASLSVVFLDLDHFKKINDNHGHAAGDFVLKEFANLVKNNFTRPRDLFARYGGEEFVLMLSNTSADAGLLIAEKVRSAVEGYPFIFEGKKLPVTSSLGIAEISDAYTTAEAFLNAADAALYQSKQNGRNRVTRAG